MVDFPNDISNNLRRPLDLRIQIDHHKINDINFSTLYTKIGISVCVCVLVGGLVSLSIKFNI